jgi:hypothetical protein
VGISKKDAHLADALSNGKVFGSQGVRASYFIKNPQDGDAQR